MKIKSKLNTKATKQKATKKKATKQKVANKPKINKDYLGLIHKDMDIGALLQLTNNATFSEIFLIWNKFKCFPQSISLYGELFPNSAIMKVLKEEYNHVEENDIILKSFNLGTRYSYAHTRLCQVNESVFVYLNHGELRKNLESTQKIKFDVKNRHHVFRQIKIYFLPGYEKFADELVKKLTAIKMKKIRIAETYLQMICRDKCGDLYLNSIKIKKPMITDIKTNYGEEFAKKHDVILDALKEDESTGIVLLHGLPGTGKTHYIRYLIHEISSKQIIYVPPDLTSTIATPEFLPFMLQHTNSVLIIEDAENIIKSRTNDGTTTQAVANLLNLSDGLLGDSLHQPIIATFNCELSSIDPALLRKGRLIAEHEFGKLDVEHAQKLSDELGFDIKITEPMTLAELYPNDYSRRIKQNKDKNRSPPFSTQTSTASFSSQTSTSSSSSSSSS